MERPRRRLTPPNDAVTGSMSKKTDFVSYVGAGLLIGLTLDWLLGIGPWLTVGWTLLAVGYGYHRLWHTSSAIVEEMEKHSRGA